MDSLSKRQFLSCVENSGGKDRAHYSFDSKGLHFVVLDPNYTAAGADYDHGRFNWSDANVPRAQLDWRERDLTATTGPTIGFIHQQLDGKGAHCVKNADEVRRILRANGKVLAVFQGHQHGGWTICCFQNLRSSATPDRSSWPKSAARGRGGCWRRRC